MLTVLCNPTATCSSTEQCFETSTIQYILYLPFWDLLEIQCSQPRRSWKHKTVCRLSDKRSCLICREVGIQFCLCSRTHWWPVYHWRSMLIFIKSTCTLPLTVTTNFFWNTKASHVRRRGAYKSHSLCWNVKLLICRYMAIITKDMRTILEH